MLKDNDGEECMQLLLAFKARELKDHLSLELNNG